MQNPDLHRYKPDFRSLVVTVWEHPGLTVWCRILVPIDFDNFLKPQGNFFTELTRRTMRLIKESGNESPDVLAIDDTPDEVAMVQDFVRGKPHAFRAIFEYYHRPLYYHALRFVKSPELARDVVQDVFIKLLERKDSIKPDRPLKAYLFTIAKNHILNMLTRASCEARIKREIIAHAVLSCNQEDDIIYNDFKRFAERAIECLPPQRKRIFKMFKDEGKDYHQIADALGISRHTVRDHLAKASKFVRGYLKVHTGIISILLAFFLFR